MKLEDHSIIITGGASGVGYHAALALAVEGANVQVADLNLDGATKVAAQVASVVAFLFTEAASAINESTIAVEDGFQVFKNR